MAARAAHGDEKLLRKGLTGSGKHGGVEKKVEVVEVRRYWPGKAPKWSTETDGRAEEEEVGFYDAGVRGLQGSGSGAASSSGAVDRRLQRLAEAAGSGRRRGSAAEVIDEEKDELSEEEGEDDRERDHRSRRARAPEILEEAEEEEKEEEEEEEDDDAIAARRARLLAKRRAAIAEEEAAEAEAEAEEEAAEGSEAEDSSEYETDSEDEAADGARVMLKPVFVVDSERETLQQRDLLEREEEEGQRRRETRLKERQGESRQLLVDIVRQEAEGAAAAAQAELDFADMPDDDDEVDELAQFDFWKVRELKRVRRERAEREAARLEAAELERRRNLTDEQRAEEDEEFRKQRADYGQEKGKWKFLQKYYHKGAYFQDEDESGNAKIGPVMMQDFGAATGKDSIGDKASMPAPMQVKNFGMRSQVKWTHLTAEDTSTKDALWAENKDLTHKYENRMAGYKGANEFSRPSGKRKQSDF